jgi:hypothetical protein
MRSLLFAISLICPPSEVPCAQFHYHVALFRPDTHSWVNVSAGPAFPTSGACERARDTALRRNAAVVLHFQKLQTQKYEADQFGPCHCDRTTDPTSTTYLSDAARTDEIRAADNVRQQVAESLLQAVELQSVEPMTVAEAAPVDPAGVFIPYETERIQNVLKAAGAISDEKVKARIFEACMQRIQLLSNLRALIEAGGPVSRLALAAAEARDEPQRQELARRLFGSAVAATWAPRDARDVILTPVDVDTNPEQVLRDRAGSFSADQKRRALYSLLARTQPGDQQLQWLLTVIDAFLQS